MIEFFLKKADGMHRRSASPETGVPAKDGKRTLHRQNETKKSDSVPLFFFR
jgi:hypothetical protein